jgi:hypothetical protein
MSVFYYKENMGLFWKFIAERHEIYKRKELQNLPPPWTKDPILADFKFTNIFRELDRGTRFVTEWLQKQEYVDDASFFFNHVLYRLFNKIETFLYHGHMPDYRKYDQEGLRLRLLNLSANENVFTNAFTVSGYSMFGFGMDKITRISLLLGQITDQLNDDEKSGCLRDAFDKSMEECYYYLRSIQGIGPFLGYQIAVDLSYSDRTKFGEDDFVIDGPGAKRGLHELFTEKTIEDNGYEELNYWLRNNQLKNSRLYDVDFLKTFEDQPYPYLTVMSLENCLCEFSKYMKAYEDRGRPRNRYMSRDGWARSIDANRDVSWKPAQWTFNKYNKPANMLHVAKILGVHNG